MSFTYNKYGSHPYTFMIYQDEDGINVVDSEGNTVFSGTDAASVIQQAINNVTAGGMVFIKGGDYQLTAKLTSANEVFIKGEGKATRLLPTGAFDAVDLTNIRVSDLIWRSRNGVDYDTTLSNYNERYRIINVPTNAAWFTSTVGSGGYTLRPTLMTLYTGTTASSSMTLYTVVFGLNSLTSSMYVVDWRKRLEIHFSIGRYNSDAECVARFQLKESNALGALTQKGVGVEIANFALRGEGYGTARSTVDLMTLANDRPYEIIIVKDGSRLEFWVNNVLLGQLSGNYVPNVLGTADAYFVASINNGTTGGVNATFYVGNIYIIQER
jgi:hypothetical protein